MKKSNLKLVVVPIGPAECADKLGVVKASIAEMGKLADEYKAVLIAAAAEGPESVFEGDLFRASVSFVDRPVIDNKGVIKELAEMAGLGEVELFKLLGKHTKVAAGVPFVKVSAR